MTNLKVWDFIEKYHPTYSSSSIVAIANDLFAILEAKQKLIEGKASHIDLESDSAKQMLMQEFGNNIHQLRIQDQYAKAMGILMGEAIENFMGDKTSITSPPLPESASEIIECPKVWRDGGAVEGRKYARQCDITGEGMDKGWVVNNSETYIKYESDAYAFCKKHWNQTLKEAYDESERLGGDAFYHTEWDDESDYQYILKEGVLISLEDYEEPIDESTLKQEHFTPTEEMLHRLQIIMDEVAEIRKWAYQQKAPENILTLFNNVEIACDLDDNESLNWSRREKD